MILEGKTVLVSGVGPGLGGEIPEDDDVAEVAVLFCSDRMRVVTGQYLRVDGGERMTF